MSVSTTDHAAGSDRRDYVAPSDGRDYVAPAGGRDHTAGSGGRDQVVGSNGRDRTAGSGGRKDTVGPDGRNHTVGPVGRGRRAAARARRAAGRALATLARSVAIFVPVFLVATFVTFALRAISGLSPAQIQLGENATPEAVARIEHEWGLDRPFLAQYWTWFENILRGDLGTSWSNGADIAMLISDGLAVSLSVAALALVIGIVGGFALGTLAALRRTTWVDRAVTGFTTFMSVVPPFVVGIVLVTIFAVGLGWLPSAGYMPASAGAWPWLSHLLLPALALSFDTVADVARQLRAGLIAAYRENYVIGAVVRGLSPRRIFFKQVLRNGTGPALAVLGYKLPTIIGGAVVTEWIFGLQGFGRFANDSAQAGDVPAVQGVLVVSIVLVVTFNLLVNIILARVTPASQRGL